MNIKSIQAEAFCRIRSRVISTLNNADSIYVDTCTLMHEAFADFIKIFGGEFRKQAKKLIILTQVYDELKKLATPGNTDFTPDAQKALRFIEKNEHLFQFHQEFDNIRHADKVFCKLLAQQCLTQNQILLTEDYALTASICNLCSCDTEGSIDYNTTVLTLMNGAIPRQRTEKQLRCAPGVEIPFWPLYAQSSYTPRPESEQSAITSSYEKKSEENNLPEEKAARPAAEQPNSKNIMVADTPKLNKKALPVQTDTSQNIAKRLNEKQYSEALLKSSTLYMTRATLIDLFIHNRGVEFIQHLHNLYLRGIHVRIRVMENSLDAQLREKMSTWMHLFKICAPLSPLMSETHALLSKIGTACYNKNHCQYILISSDEAQFEIIRKRIPSCHTILPLMRGCLSDKGTLYSPYKRHQYTLAAEAIQSTITA